jgi:hypothetical protein
MLADYYSQPSNIVPQKQERFFKYKVGDRVVVALSPLVRRDFSFKYSLFPGKNNDRQKQKRKTAQCLLVAVFRFCFLDRDRAEQKINACFRQNEHGNSSNTSSSPCVKTKVARSNV